MAKISEKGDSALRSSATNSSLLFGSSSHVDPVLASLFATTPIQVNKAHIKKLSRAETAREAGNDDDLSSESEDDISSSVSEDSDTSNDSEVEDSSSESLDRGEESILEDADTQSDPADSGVATEEDIAGDSSRSRRKRKRDDDDIEGKHLQRLAQEEAREEAKRESKRQKASYTLQDEVGGASGESLSEDEQPEGDSDEEETSDFEVPKHETLTAPSESPEFEKANRTVFLGNVSSEAISSNSAKKTLLRHMSSILDSLPSEKDLEVSHKIESIRFRSTAYTNILPRKAAFAQKDLMDATTHSTNAYIVYTTRAAARASLKLNGTVVLNRHLRVDSVAHPAKTETRRCVFVGNLGFVDDESGIQGADDEEGKKKKKQKEPGDVEEGLWREFGKCGTVENVRVVRDSKTRVGKGIAYVQFTDENAVESALLLDGKKFPPLLPRKLRVTRAKTIKRNAAAKREATSGRKANGIYNPKISAEQKSAQGRAGKLFGRAGAAMMNRPVRSSQLKGARPTRENSNTVTEIKNPESFVFEGHRAKRGSYTANKKVKKGKKKVGKPVNRSSKRAAAWRKGGGGQ